MNPLFALILGVILPTFAMSEPAKTTRAISSESRPLVDDDGPLRAAYIPKRDDTEVSRSLDRIRLRDDYVFPCCYGYYGGYYYFGCGSSWGYSVCGPRCR